MQSREVMEDQLGMRRGVEENRTLSSCRSGELFVLSLSLSSM